MSEHTQTIAREDANRITIEISGADLTLRWQAGTDEISVFGQELSVERAADEIFLRGESSTGRGGLFNKLRDFSGVDVSVDLSKGRERITIGGEEISPERVSSEIINEVNRALGGAGSSAESSIVVELPSAITVTSVEVEKGDLKLMSPQGKVDCQVKTGDFTATGGTADLSVSAGSGDTDVSDLNGTLTIMAGSGEVDVRDAEASVSVKAGSGEVTIVRSTGDSFDVMAGSGDVDLIECTGRDLSVQTGSGDATVDGGKIDRLLVRTGSGDVRSTTVFGRHSQSFMTGSGSVSLGIPQGVPARFEASTLGGEIESEIQLVTVGQRGPKSRRTRRQVGSIGTGEPRADVSVRTGTGGIKLHWLMTSEIPVPQTPVPSQPAAGRGEPEPQDAPTTPEPSAGLPEPQTTADPRLEILEALARGDISPNEADILLSRIDASSE